MACSMARSGPMGRPEKTSCAAGSIAGADGRPQRVRALRLRALALIAALWSGVLSLLGGCSRLLSIVDPSAF